MNDLFAPCIVCGRPAAPHGEHHHVELGGGATGPVGMGGSSKDHEDERIVLCRQCHQDTHMKLTTIRRKAPYFLITRNGVESKRAMEEVDVSYDGDANELIRNLRTATDASLLTVAADAMEHGATDALAICVVLAELRQRYASFGDGFASRATEMIRDHTGVGLSVGSVYNWTNIGVAALLVHGDKVLAFQQLGKTVLSAAGHAISAGVEPTSIIPFIEEARDEGRRMTEVAKEVAAMEGKQKTKPPKCADDGLHRCTYCREEFADE